MATSGSLARRRSGLLAAVGGILIAGSVITLTVLLPLTDRPGGAADAPLTFGEAPLVRWLTWIGLLLLVSATGLAGSVNRRSALGDALLTLGWLGETWAAWTGLSPDLRAAVLALTPLAVVGISFALAPAAQLGRSLRAVIALAAVAVTLQMLAYDPFDDPGCRWTCVAVHRPLAGALGPRVTLALVALLTVGASVVAGVGLLRRPLGSRIVAYAALAPLGLVAGAAVVRSATTSPGGTPVLEPVLMATVVIVTAMAQVGEGWRVRRVRRRVAELARLLRPGGDPAPLLSAVVAVAVPGTSRWVGRDGRDVTPSPSLDALLIRDAQGPVMQVSGDLRRGSGSDLAEITPTVRLALRTVQLDALTRARLHDVAASRRRVVVAAETARRRMERDLHDGAQQRLVGITFHLASAQSHAVGPEAARLQSARSAVLQALTELRRLAHGLRPGDLSGRGLEAALDDLVESTASDTRLQVRVDPAVDDQAGAAAYALIAAAVRTGGDPHVEVMSQGKHLHVRLSGLDAESTLIDEALERIRALGGTVTRPPGINGTPLQVVIPCAS